MWGTRDAGIQDVQMFGEDRIGRGSMEVRKCCGPVWARSCWAMQWTLSTSHLLHLGVQGPPQVLVLSTFGICLKCKPESPSGRIKSLVNFCSHAVKLCFRETQPIRKCAWLTDRQARQEEVVVALQAKAGTDCLAAFSKHERPGRPGELPLLLQHQSPLLFLELEARPGALSSLHGLARTLLGPISYSNQDQ